MHKEASLEEVIRLLKCLKAQASESVAESRRLIALASQRLEESQRRSHTVRRAIADQRR